MDAKLPPELTFFKATLGFRLAGPKIADGCHNAKKEK